MRRITEFLRSFPAFVARHRGPSLALTGLLALLVVVALVNANTTSLPHHDFTEPQFMEALSEGRLNSVVVNQGRASVGGEGFDADSEFTYTFHYLVSAEDELLEALRTHAPDYEVATSTSSAAGVSPYGMLVLASIIAFTIFFLRRGALGASSRTAPVERPDFGFDRLGGLDEAIVEISEVTEFLLSPERFANLGAKPPRAILLEGPSGTGKTALARAAASEANAPFYAVSASEFVEMFVGVGARRVRALFKQALETAPSVIFIDEIDAVGRARGAGTSRGNEEYENTLNQLLTEMDGFSTAKSPVVVMAATNRSDILDPALLRRFSRHIHVGLPDPRGREKILSIHLSDVPTADDLDVVSLSRRTAGFSGSDLERLVNEAAVYAARQSSSVVTEDHLEIAFDRIVLGLERPTAVVSAKDREIVAYHEAGHTLCAYISPDADRPHKVSLVPRGSAGGVTHFTPTDSAFMTHNRARASLVAMMGGRAAEELLLGDDFTSGAAHDIESADRLARHMVGSYGMSNLGLLHYNPERGVSPDTAREVEAEVSRLLSSALEQARAIVTEHRPTLEALVAALYEKETLGPTDIEEVLGPLSASSPASTSTTEPAPPSLDSSQA